VWRRGARALVATVVGTVVPTAVASRTLRDQMLTRPWFGDFGPPHNTLPSTHMAVVTSLAVAVVLFLRLSPPSARAEGRPRRRLGWVIVWLGAALVAEGTATVVSYAHRPSDVVAGVALAALWWCLGWVLLVYLQNRKDKN
jgi:membrane-associated phospholipid phosphatase